MTKTRALLCAVVVGVLVAGGATAVRSATRSRVVHDRGLILLAGDSNMQLSTGYLVDALALNYPSWSRYTNAYTPTFLVHYGAGIRYGDCLDVSRPCSSWDYWPRRLSATLAKIDPDAVVTNLGINDAPAPGSPTTLGYARYGKKIDYFMRAIPKKTPVLWLTLPCRIEPASYVAGCQLINTRLKGATSRWRNLRVVDWASVANLHPEFIVSGDVHFTPAGYGSMSDLIARRLDATLAK